MGYGVYIERACNRPIGIEEWIEAVERTEDVRLSDVAHTVLTNSNTGEQIFRRNTPGTAEIFDNESQTWVPAFRWADGRISTGAARDFDNYTSHQRSVMRALAALLSAQIVGDEGETYD